MYFSQPTTFATTHDHRRTPDDHPDSTEPLPFSLFLLFLLFPFSHSHPTLYPTAAQPLPPLPPTAAASPAKPPTFFPFSPSSFLSLSFSLLRLPPTPASSPPPPTTTVPPAYHRAPPNTTTLPPSSLPLLIPLYAPGSAIRRSILATL
nr:extensin-like [Arachis hypogaea]